MQKRQSVRPNGLRRNAVRARGLLVVHRRTAARSSHPLRRPLFGSSVRCDRLRGCRRRIGRCTCTSSACTSPSVSTLARSTSCVKVSSKPSGLARISWISNGTFPVQSTRSTANGLRPRDPQPRLVPPTNIFPFSVISKAKRTTAETFQKRKADSLVVALDLFQEASHHGAVGLVGDEHLILRMDRTCQRSYRRRRRPPIFPSCRRETEPRAARNVGSRLASVMNAAAALGSSG